MRKKVLMVLMLLIFMLPIFALTGCESKINKGDEYYLYTYEYIKGDFFKNNAKIAFKRKDYSIYNNDYRLTGSGTYSTENEMTTLIPEKIGEHVNQYNSAVILYVKGEYLIEQWQYISRITNTKFEDKSAIDGIYNTNIKLSEGVIYKSIDGSNAISSFTERIGNYEINKNKDFIVATYDNGVTEVYLKFSYTDTLGYEVCALAKRFYSNREPNFKPLKMSGVELNEKIFVSKSSTLESTYDLSLLSYPDKNVINEGVSYRITAGAVNNARIQGNVLYYTGDGALTIEYTYGNIIANEYVYIVDNNIKADLTDNQRTYYVGNEVSYADILGRLADYSTDSLSYELVAIEDITKAICKDNKVIFIAPGDITAKLTVRYVASYDDGSERVYEKTQNTVIKILNVT